MLTPHLEAKIDDIAKIVLMPGDPLRAKYIADNFLTNVKVINNIRNMLGFTGYYKDVKITVIGSGMGIPSMGIYSYELYKFYNVDKIIRIGTCGAYIKDLELLDIILVNNSYSESSYALLQNNCNEKLISATEKLNDKIEEIAINNNIKIKKGNIHTSEVFTPYMTNINIDVPLNQYNCIGAEMEAFALFHNAKIFNKEAACILTVSDSMFKNNDISPEDREKSLNQMIELSLKTAINL